MTCWLWFHKWSKWEKYSLEGKVQSYSTITHAVGKTEIIGKTDWNDTIVVRQKRYCKRCGFNQDTLMFNGFISNRS